MCLVPWLSGFNYCPFWGKRHGQRRAAAVHFGWPLLLFCGRVINLRVLHAPTGKIKVNGQLQRHNCRPFLQIFLFSSNLNVFFSRDRPIIINLIRLNIKRFGLFLYRLIGLEMFYRKFFGTDPIRPSVWP